MLTCEAVLALPRQWYTAAVFFKVAVLMHRQGDEQQIHPPAEVVLGAGDGLVVSAELDALTRLVEHTTPTRELLRRQQDLCKPG